MKDKQKNVIDQIIRELIKSETENETAEEKELQFVNVTTRILLDALGCNYILRIVITPIIRRMTLIITRIIIKLLNMVVGHQWVEYIDNKDQV